MKITIFTLIIFVELINFDQAEEEKKGYFASCSDDNKIILWNKIVDHVILGWHDKPVKSLEILSNEILISGSSDGIVKVWNLTSFNLSYSFNLSSGITKILKFNESSFFISLANFSLFHFMLNDVQPIGSCDTNHSNRITGLKLIDNQLIVTSSLDGNLNLWNISLKLQKSVQLNSSILSLEVNIQHNQKIIYCGSQNGIYEFNSSLALLNTNYNNLKNETIISLLYIKNDFLSICTNSSKLILGKKELDFRENKVLTIERIRQSHIATGLTNGSILILNYNSENIHYTLIEHQNKIYLIKSISYRNAQYFPYPIPESSQNHSNSTNSIININEMTVEEVSSLLSTEADLTDCLGNCSNNGICKNNSLKFYCSCFSNYGGSSCQINTNPCSSNPCLNNGLCIEDLIKSTYQCNCTNLYEGRNCQIKLDVCSNQTCSSNGYCVDENNYPKCRCFNQFSGEKCEIESNEIKVKKFVVTSSKIIALLIIFLFFILLLIIDLSELCCKKILEINLLINKSS